MSYQRPTPGPYQRIADGMPVEVIGCTGEGGMASVSVQGDRRRWYVRLENFWRKYREMPEQGGAV